MFSWYHDRRARADADTAAHDPAATATYQRKIDAHVCGNAWSRQQEQRLLKALAVPMDMLGSDSVDAQHSMRAELLQTGVLPRMCLFRDSVKELTLRTRACFGKMQTIRVAYCTP